MKLKTMKGKLIAGAIVIGLVSSAGVAFANTDAGQALQNWYDEAFGQTVDEATQEAREYGEDQIPGLVDEYEGVKADASAAIDETRADETGSSIEEISAAKDSHIESVEGTKEEIMRGMEKEIYDVYMEGWLEIQALGDEAIAYADSDLTQYTGGEGVDAVAQATSDLTAAKEDAVTELEDAIENAKNELSDELGSHGDYIVNNLTGDIDSKIDEVRKAVDGITANLVQEQQSIIASEAQELEDDAKQALDDVVAGIGN